MKDFILATLLVIGLNAMLWLIVIDEVSRPDVYMSWSSKECIKVEHSKTHDCDNLPEKYNTVWVQ
jgi:hypothetical protein